MALTTAISADTASSQFHYIVMCNSANGNNGNIYSLTYLFYSFMADIAGIFFCSGLECGTYSQIICAIFFSKNRFFNCMRRNADDFRQ